MNLKFFFLFALTLGLGSLQGYGQSLHFILVANTQSTHQEFAQICQVDSIKMYDKMAEVASTLELNFRPHFITGDHFTSKNLTSLLNDLRFGNDDICFFYYSGAAFCEAEAPDMNCNRILRMGKDGKDLLSTTVIFPVIQEKAARLNIFFVDGCSKVRALSAKGKSQGDARRKVYESLFIKVSGTIRLFSSKCGQYSYGDTKNGSAFTNSFLDTLEFFIQNKEEALTWSVFFKEAHDVCYKRVKAKTNRPQNPDMCPKPSP